MNTVYLIGNVGKDAEFKADVGSGLLRFSLATSERYTKKDGSKGESTTWHNIVMWGERGKALANVAKKGQMMMVVGSIKTRQYEKDGQKRTATEVDARDCVALFANKSAQVDAPADKPAKPDAGSSIDDDDIPF